MWSLYIQINEEEDPAGHVMEGPSPSTVTEWMSGDVDPADHVPDSCPPPQITDQISAVSHISHIYNVNLGYASLKIVSTLPTATLSGLTCSTDI